MGATQVVPVGNGGTIAVRTGVLRGAGPQGPMGPQGLQGNPGPPGAQGPQGAINALMTKIDSTASVSTSYDKWYPMTMDSRGQDDLLVPGVDGLNLQFKNAINVLMVMVARFETTHAPSDGGTAAGGRMVHLVDASGAMLNNATVHVEAAHNEPTWLLLIAVIQPDPSKFYHFEGKSRDDIGVNCTERHVTFVQIGAGPPGPVGPPGAVGSTGPQGATGPAGSAGSGYGSYNAVATGTPDTTIAPGGVTYLTTADQGIRTPSGTDLPATPYFLQRAVQDLEPLLVARYASVADRTSKRPNAGRHAGEVTYLDDSGSLQYREKVGGADNNIARLIVSASTPPSGAGQAAPGVIWAQQ